MAAAAYITLFRCSRSVISSPQDMGSLIDGNVGAGEITVPDQISGCSHGRQAAADQVRPAAAVVAVSHQCGINCCLPLLFLSVPYLFSSLNVTSAAVPAAAAPRMRAVRLFIAISIPSFLLPAHPITELPILPCFIFLSGLKMHLPGLQTVPASEPLPALLQEAPVLRSLPRSPPWKMTAPESCLIRSAVSFFFD